MPDKDEEESPARDDEEFDARLREIEAKGAQIKGTARMPDPPDWSYQRPRNIPGKDVESTEGYMGLGIGLTMAYTVVGLTVLGWGAGKLIDMRMGGTVGQAIGTLVGAFTGLGIGIYQLLKAQAREEAKKKAK